MSSNHLILSIVRLCREAGVSVNALMRVSTLSQNTFTKWRREPEKMSEDSIRALCDGAGRVIDAMAKLRGELIAALPADDPRRQ